MRNPIRGRCLIGGSAHSVAPLPAHTHALTMLNPPTNTHIHAYIVHVHVHGYILGARGEGRVTGTMEEKTCLQYKVPGNIRFCERSLTGLKLATILNFPIDCELVD